MWAFCLKSSLIASPIILHVVSFYFDDDTLHLYLIAWHLFNFFGHLMRIQQEFTLHCFATFLLRLFYEAPIIEFYDVYWMLDALIVFAWVSAGMIVSLVLKYSNSGINFELIAVCLSRGTPLALLLEDVCYILNLKGTLQFIKYERQHVVPDQIAHQLVILCTATFKKGASKRKKKKQGDCVICYGDIRSREGTPLSCFATHKYPLDALWSIGTRNLRMIDPSPAPCAMPKSVDWLWASRHHE